MIRFGAIERLYGEKGVKALFSAHVCIVGIGGVGSWVAESLARSGVGSLTLVDLDDICETNINRQIHSLSSTVGKSKIQVMKDRIEDINPECLVNLNEDFLTSESYLKILDQEFTYVVDAIDSAKNKCLLLSECTKRNIPCITVGGAGGKTDPSLIEKCDLSKTHGDRLLFKVRRNLRREYGFPKSKKFGIPAVFLPQEPVVLNDLGEVCKLSKTTLEGKGLDCYTGLGSVTFVTGTMGFFAASKVINDIIEKC